MHAHLRRFLWKYHRKPPVYKYNPLRPWAIMWFIICVEVGWHKKVLVYQFSKEQILKSALKSFGHKLLQNPCHIFDQAI